MTRTSRLPGFYKLSQEERTAAVARWAGLNAEERALLATGGLGPAAADKMIENGLGTHALPLGIAPNFHINGRDYLVPMVVEEASVVAAASHAAKLARAGGGFRAEATASIMVGQIQVIDVPDLEAARRAILAQSKALLAAADACQPRMVQRGGGARGIEVRLFPRTRNGDMLVVHLLFDTRDAMGANLINSAVETLAPRIAALAGGTANLRILSNLTDQRLATARCVIPTAVLACEGMSGAEVARRIEAANTLARVDPYRAATHNKGIMNGVDAVAIATGNDWRALEAGAHAYAAGDGQYRALTAWRVEKDGSLSGALTLPLAVGTVGGATRVHPTAQVALKILGVASAAGLAQVMVSVGLAQNLAALRALVTSGIQTGHMQMHARQVALAAGATGDDVDAVSAQLIADGAIRLDHAEALLAEM